jgi:hypothetical protein
MAVCTASGSRTSLRRTAARTPSRKARTAGVVRVSRAAERLEQVVDGPPRLQLVAERPAEHDVGVAAADLAAAQVARGLEVAEDQLHRALGDPDGLGDVAQPGVAVTPHDQQHVGVVGEERPGASCRPVRVRRHAQTLLPTCTAMREIACTRP